MKTAFLGWSNATSVSEARPPQELSAQATPAAELAERFENERTIAQPSLFSTSELARLWTLDEVSQFLGMSKAWVRDHATRREPRIPCVRLGGRRAILRFRRQDLIDFVNRQAAAANDVFSKQS